MPVTTLRIPSVSQLSPAGIRALQNAARRESEIVVSTGSRLYAISHVQMLNGFTVEAVRGGVLDRLLRRERQMEISAAALERQLNGGVDFLSYFQGVMAEHREDETNSAILQNKINSCVFRPGSGEFSCPEQFVTCPITLDIPVAGVFMKNSRSAETCTLYDKDALVQLVEGGGAHPLSREPITESMIVKPEDCIFDASKGNFIIK
ncbi:TPA: DUF1076 domain-containing protein [Escherichia coli]|nr:DUF1076 domain-containing protein [Escherichia coli]